MIYEPTTAEIEALAREMRKSFPPNDIIDSRTNAAWILSRFVRREKHERLLAHIESSHNEVVCSSADRHAKDGNDPLPRLTCMTWDAHRLRTELHGQRCGGDGTLRGVRPGSMIGESEWIRCPSCPACTPEVTPKRVSPFCPECGAESPNGHFEKCSHSRPPQATPKGDGGCARESVSTAEEQAAPPVATSGYQSAAPAPVEHVVKLHPETLRALVAALLMGGLFSLDNSDIEAYQLGGKIADHQWAAAFTVSAADALLAELNKETQP